MSIQYLRRGPVPERENEQLVKTGMVVTTAASLYFGIPLWVKDAFAESGGDLVAVLGGTSPIEILRRTLDEIGGINSLVNKGDKVVIKPNIGWTKTPELGANTSPQIRGELVKLSLDAGAHKVEVLDHTCQEWHSCYRLSGIEEAVKKNGGTMVPANNKKYYKTVSLPKGKILKKTKIHETLIKSDVWLNVQMLKHHAGASMSIYMKNNMAIVWDRQIFQRDGLQQCIANLCTWEKQPTLNIVDGWRTMVKNGPSGVSVEGVVKTKAMFTSSHPERISTKE